MLKLAAGVLAVVATFQDSKTPDLHYEQNLGFSIQKPAKKEEWQFKVGGTAKLKAAKVAVNHRVENLSVEFIAEPPPADGNSYDVKATLEKEYEAVSANEGFKDVKKKKFEAAVLPGGAASGAKAWYLEVTGKDKANEAPWEIRYWCFLGKENRHIYMIVIINSEKVYEKNKKEVEYILSTMRTYKIPKK